MNRYKVTHFQFDLDSDGRLISKTESETVYSLEKAYEYAICQIDWTGSTFDYYFNSDTGKIVQVDVDEEIDEDCTLLPENVEHRSWTELGLGTWTGEFARDEIMSSDERWAKLMIDAGGTFTGVSQTPVAVLRQKLEDPNFVNEKLVICVCMTGTGTDPMSTPSMCYLERF